MCNCNQQIPQPVEQNCGKPIPPQPNCDGCIDQLSSECIQYLDDPDAVSGLTFLNLSPTATLREILEAIDRAFHTLNSKI